MRRKQNTNRIDIIIIMMEAVASTTHSADDQPMPISMDSNAPVPNEDDKPSPSVPPTCASIVSPPASNAKKIQENGKSLPANQKEESLPASNAKQIQENEKSRPANQKKETLNKKRPAEEELPSLGKEIALQKFSLIPPTIPKRKTLYARFKVILTKKMKVEGEKLTAADAKAAWTKVENHSGWNENNKENNQANLTVWLDSKNEAIKVEAEEKQKLEAALVVWRTEVKMGAEAFLQYAIMEATVENMAELVESILKVVTLVSLPQWEGPVAGLKDARVELARLRKECWIRNKVSVLKNSTDEQLRKHALSCWVLEGKARILQKLQDAKNKKEQEDLARARGFKDEIISELKSQMKYTQELKNCNVQIYCRINGVTTAMFVEAFGEPSGSAYRVTWSGDILGIKELRYGARLVCSDITVSLGTDGELLACTMLKMEKRSMFGWH